MPRSSLFVIIVALSSLTAVSWIVGADAPPEQPAAPAAKTATLPAAPKPPPEPADNSYCYVCHANYEQEEMTETHQPVGVGCESCHGVSEKHSGDEDGLTPPEIMYPKDRINESCMKCHAQEQLVDEQEHGELFAEPKSTKTCTECHAKDHRLKVRTRIWDKKTGKLLSDDGVRMMYENSPASGGKPPEKKPE